MKKLIATAAVAGIALLAPVAAAAAEKPETIKPAKLCAAEKRADRDAFKETYGKRAMRTCIKGVKEEVRNAARDCKEERAVDPDAFKEAWGSGPKLRNAFGKCVSAAVKSDGNDEGTGEKPDSPGKSKGHDKRG